jgi:hypothetical protein
MITEKSPEISSKFYCKFCDYKCSKQSEYNKHILTSKHKNNDGQLHKNLQNIQKYTCECGKEYSFRQGLYSHKKKCTINEKCNNEEQNNQITPELIMSVLHQNKELQQMLIEQNKTIIELSKNSSMTNCNNTTNSHNKSFNLNFFLNETCKDAMNIMEFVDSLKLQLSDLENVGKLGFVEGISKIIVSNLKSLDETKRPVHCTDSKREIMYVKDEDKWEKESENNHKVLKAIEDIANKNSKMVKEWKTKNPECASSKSHKADVYSHIMIEAVCSNNDTNNSKILKKIAKEVTIDKNM